MVLESVIVDVLNKFLGEYVESVDKSQLKVAFGGDIALDDLVLKQNALDELDLPVKTIYGRLGKLVLTIPWTNLYKAPWIVRIERVFLLSVPNEEVKYDAEREERIAQENKQKELLQVEEAKKREAEKGLDKKENATFVENLIAHIIKNVQVTIKNIHLRYEDQVTNPGSPFSIGLTLSQLKLQSTDESGKPTVAQQSISIFHKVLTLEGLAFYWNSNSELFSKVEESVRLKKFQQEIATKNEQPKGYTYMFGPISATAQLQLNPKPEHDGSNFSIPKIQLDMNMDILAIGVSKMQYRDLVKFLESMDRMARAAPYRQYRPFLNTYIGNGKEWWRFAYKCILETEVRRKHRNFDWLRIKKHRSLCRRYETAYKEKISTKKPSAETLQIVEDCEKQLDSFNIVILRQQAEMQVQKIRKKEEETKKNAGWFGGWWGGGTQKSEEATGTAAELANKFEAAMTPAEKAKLYQAIGYQENAAPAQYPPTFVAVQASFSLGSLQVVVRDEQLTESCVLKLVVAGVTCGIEQRPSALANKVEVKMKQLEVTGIPQDGAIPSLAYSLISKEEDAVDGSDILLNVLFETNPIDRSCDQRVRVTAQPLELVYDAQTVIHILDVFNPPEKPSLSQLQAMAVSKLEEIREVSATLLQHAIQQQKVMDLDIRLAASRMILPQGGKMCSGVPVLVVSLGSLSVSSCQRDPNLRSIGNMVQSGSSEQEVLQEMISQSYDKFSLSLKDMQVLVAQPNEDWKRMLHSASDWSLHLVQPTSIDISLHRSLLPNDPRIPQFKVAGQLPSLALSLSEERLLMTAGIFVSIPFPESDIEPPSNLQEASSRSSSMLTLQQIGKIDRRKNSAQSSEALDLIVGSVKLELWFEMKELRVTVLRQNSSGKNERLLDFSLLSLELEMTQRSFDTSVILRLGGICMDQTVFGVDHRVISTPMADGRADYLFTTKLLMVDRKSPEFHTKHGSVEKLIEVSFTSLNLLLHQNGILQIMEFANVMQDKISSLQSKAPKNRTASTRPAVDRLLSVIPEEGGTPTVKPAGRSRKHMKEIIQLRFIAQLENLSIQLANAERALTCLTLQGVKSSITMTRSHMQVDAALKTMQIRDLNPNTSYTKIVESEGDEALSAKVVMYENPTESQPQMIVTAQMACLRIIFLNRFVSSLLGFLNNFQTAMDAVKQASAAAASAAKQNMQQAYENATKIALKIEIKAPIVLVPRSMHRSDAFLLDFGVITLQNKFYDELVDGKKATLDILALSLRELQLKRVTLDDNAKVVDQTHLIRPFNFTIDVERNLSMGWYKKKPGVNLKSNLAPIKLDVRQEDINLAMWVLAENLGDVEPEPENAETPQIPDNPEIFAKTQPKRPTTLKGVSRMHSDVSQGEEVEELPEGVYNVMSFLFNMESIEFNLLLPTNSPTKSHDHVHGLAHFTIQSLKIKGSMTSDNNIGVKMSLQNCILKDLRQFKEASESRILDLMSLKRRNLQAGQAPTTMINVEFEKTAVKTKLTAKVAGFDLVLCLDYLLKVSDFFVSAMPKVDTPAPVVKQKVQSSSDSKVGSTVTRQLSNKPPESIFELIVVLEKPDIILVESMSDINTKALIFSVEGDCRVQMTPERQALNVEIKDIQLYSCCFNPEKRQDTLSQVLRPCTLSVAGGCNSGQQPCLAVDLSAVRVSVSPVTIGILTNCLNTLGSSQQDQLDEELPAPPDWSLIWRPKGFKDNDYWFLATEEGQDALAMLEAQSTPPMTAPANDGGLIMLSVASFIVTIEAGTGIKTLPLILLESSLQARVSNWTSNLEIQGELSLQMAYYNSRLALWEPLIEPVEVIQDKHIAHSPWQLSFEVKMNPQTTPIASPYSDAEDVTVQQPSTWICVRSEENLEVTISRCCLDVFDALGKAFQTAMKEGLKGRSEDVSPYMVQNQTGMRVILLLEDTNFFVEVEPGSGNIQNVKQVVLESGAQIGLVLKEINILSPVRPGTSILQEQVHEKILPIKVPDKNCVIKLPMARAEKRYFSLTPKGEKSGAQGLVSEVSMEGGSRITTLRSIIQVHNLFSMPVDVYFMTRRGNEVECVGIVQPGQKLDLPLHAVYTPTSEIFFSLPGHTVCITPFVWKDLLNTVSISKTLRCDPKNKDVKDPFFLKAVGDMEQVFFEATSMHTMASCVFNITLRPTVVLRNLLPITLVCVAGRGLELEIAAGGRAHLPAVEAGQSDITLRLDDYLEKLWSCKHDIAGVPPELAVWSFDSWDSSAKMTLDLGVHTVNVHGTLYMSLYSPFWMINKTGLMLSYRKSRKTEKNEAAGSPLKRWASNLSISSISGSGSSYFAQSEDNTNTLYHPPDFVGPILFSFRPKVFFGKKKACVKIEESDWSNKFSLDVAGSSGSVSCKSQQTQQLYQVGVSIQLAHSNLTKLVTFTPYYMLVNHAPFEIECQEADRPADPWVTVEPGNCSPLWPNGLGHHDNTLRLRVKGTSEITTAFNFTESHTTLLKLHNKYGGINIDIQVSEGAIYISMSAYEPGLAPALIINHTHSTVEFWEMQKNPTIKKLAPMEQALYSWEDPRGSRKLVWNSMNNNNKKEEIADMLRKDGLGKLWMGGAQQPGGDCNYWVSFLDGMQRVLLFTANPNIARDAQAAADLEAVATEVTFCLHGLGLSLVSQQEKKMVELLYMGIASSGVIWESKKPNKRNFEPVNMRDNALLEDAFKKGQACATLSEGGEADLELKQIKKPSIRDLRRTYHPGLWFMMRASKHQRQFHAKLHTLQVDCQMPDCVFPTILAPVPPPKSVAADKAIRPYIEVSVVQRLLEHSPVQQFRYLRVLVQEFHVKLDMGFLGALLEVFTSEESLEADDSDKFAADVHVVEQPLLALIAVQAAQEQKNFYDELHLSPLKIHVSFSMSGGLGKVGASSQLNILNALLQNLGVTLTDLQDVVFKLGYFERQSSFLTQRQLTQEVQSHYTQQGIKQLYVLVLGLDVIGNPFGLVLGLKQGVEDLFYEPFQGAIQGPGEFAEGLKNGVRSLLGHTLSGTAAAMSRITGTVGKTLANLSFDEEYQRKRREQQMNRPTALHEGLVQSVKGLGTGVMSGVTGVITKPISGARDEGVGGFFKGIGGGLIGLVTQPTGGVIDFASNTLDTVKRAADTADETKSLRFPRYFHQDGLIRPYSHLEAFGNRLLAMVEKGRYAKTDCYVFHGMLGHSRKEAVILTDKRILLATRNDLFGQWQVEWNYPWSELPKPPSLDNNGLVIHTSEPQKRVLGLFKSGETGRSLIIPDELLRQKIWETAKKLMNDRIPKSPPR